MYMGEILKGIYGICGGLWGYIIRDVWGEYMVYAGLMGGFPKIRGTLFGVPIMSICVFWGLYWGPSILGNYYLTGDLCGI